MTRRRRVFYLFALTAILAGSLVIRILSDAPALWLVVEDPPTIVDAIVVFAGDPDYERTTTASRLMLSGQARTLILTGGEPGPGDSAVSLRDWARKQGIPDDQIRIETLSHGTHEAVLAVAPILREIGARRVGLVTSPYHQRRVCLAARKAWSGVEIHNWPACPSWWSAHRWWRQRKMRSPVISEYLKLAYYALRGWV